jgi:hypothetical protein
MECNAKMLERTGIFRVLTEDNMSDFNDSEVADAAKTLGRLGGLKGGKARAEKLSAEQRSEIAKKAVEARWARVRGEKPLSQIPKATHAGTLKIGDVELSCAVLEDGTRVLESHQS